MQAVVLSSGGLDSSLTMHLLKKQGIEVYPLHINYGQLAEPKEWTACRKMCSDLGIRPPERMDLSGLRIFPSGLVNPNLDIHDDAFLPTRNLIFLVAGGGYAYSKGLDAVVIGLVANPIFPDQTPSFVARAEDAVAEALGRRIKVLAPLIQLDKREVILLAEAQGLNLGLAYYCHRGGEEPCGVCISCKERIAAEKSVREARVGKEGGKRGRGTVGQKGRIG